MLVLYKTAGFGPLLDRRAHHREVAVHDFARIAGISGRRIASTRGFAENRALGRGINPDSEVKYTVSSLIG